jgi:hypothetical protein
MKNSAKLASLFAVTALVAAFILVVGYPQVQAQDASIVGTWAVEDEVTDVVIIFHPDGTYINVTEYSLTHPDTPQLGIWWQEGDVIYWKARGFTLSGDVTTAVNVTGTVEMNGSDEITVDPLVELSRPDG